MLHVAKHIFQAIRSAPLAKCTNSENAIFHNYWVPYVLGYNAVGNSIMVLLSIKFSSD